MRKEFLEVLSVLTELSLKVEDNFLSSKIKAKNEQLLAAFLDFNGNGVAQSKESLAKLAGLAKELDELIDLFLHLKIITLSPALTIKKHLLLLRLSIPHGTKIKKPVLSKKIENTKENMVPADRNPVNMILTLLKYRKKCQTQEIIYALRNSFSARTVQRHLYQMTKSGQLAREIVEGYPRYSINEQS